MNNPHNRIRAIRGHFSNADFPQTNLPPHDQQRLLTWASAKAPEKLHGTLSKQVCDKIANSFAQAYYVSLGADECTKVARKAAEALNQLVVPQAVAASAAWQDYLQGFALAVNPLPTEDVVTFYTSDALASAADWEAVRTDIGDVWAAVSAVGDWLSHSSTGVTPNVERSQGGGAASAEARAGEAGSRGDTVGDYSPGT